jgi:hypothetical protein
MRDDVCYGEDGIGISYGFLSIFSADHRGESISMQAFPEIVLHVDDFLG